MNRRFICFFANLCCLRIGFGRPAQALRARPAQADPHRRCKRPAQAWRATRTLQVGGAQVLPGALGTHCGPDPAAYVGPPGSGAPSGTGFGPLRLASGFGPMRLASKPCTNTSFCPIWARLKVCLAMHTSPRCQSPGHKHYLNL